MITLATLKAFIPYGIGIATTIIALKKDWIASKFTKTEKALEIKLTAEAIEAQSLANVEQTLNIYRSVVDDLKINVAELKNEVRELKDFIEQQKAFIKKQSNALAYYEKKYGRITESD